MSLDTSSPADDRDDRQGMPSASSMRRTRHCPGWLNLARSIPQRIDGGKDADEGTARHALIEIEADVSDADSNTAYTVERALQLKQEAIRRIGMADEKPLCSHKERRFWVHDDDLQRVTSARLDEVIVWQNTALVMDYKTLHGDHGDAKSNEQLLTQVVAVCETFAVGRVFAALIQPNLSADKQLSLVEYSFDDTQAGRGLLLGWLAAARDKSAPRQAGDWCKHCPARGVHCPESQEFAVVSPMVGMPANITPDAIAATLTNPRLGQFLDRVAAVESIIEAVRAEAKRRIQEGDAEGIGYTLKETGQTTTITKPEAAFGVLTEAGATQTEFTGQCITVKIGEATKLYAAKKGLSQKAARDELEAALVKAGALKKTDKKPSLKKIK